MEVKILDMFLNSVRTYIRCFFFFFFLPHLILTFFLSVIYKQEFVHLIVH